MSSKQSSFLIAGYFGFGNVGDEAILSEMIRSINSFNGSVNITALSGNAKETRKLHGINSINWTDVDEITKAVQLADVVIIGGGGLFHDYWGIAKTDVLSPGHSGIAFYTSVALLANMHNKPLRIFAVGVGPLGSETGKRWTRYVFELAEIISVRDQGSMKLLQEIGLNSREIIRVLDPVLKIEGKGRIRKKAGKTSGSPLICVSVRNWTFASGWERSVARGLDQAIEALGGQIIFVPFQINAEKLLDDRQAASLVRSKMKHSQKATVIDERMTAEDIARVIQRADLVFGMRFHSIILAVNHNIPFVALSYDPKIDNILAEIGDPSQIIDINHFGENDVSNALISTYSQKNKIIRQITKKSKKLALKYRANEEWVLGPVTRRSKVMTDKLATGELWIEVIQSLREAQEIRAQTITELEKKLTTKLAEFSQTRNTLTSELDQQKSIATALNKKLAVQSKNFGKEIDSLNATIGIWEKKYSILSKDLETAHVEISEKVKALENALADVSIQENEVQKKNIELNNLKGGIRFLDLELDSIKSSRGYRVLYFMWSLRKLFLPPGSSREKLVIDFVSFVGNMPGNIARLLRRITRKRSIKELLRKVNIALPYYLLRKHRNKRYAGDLSSVRTQGKIGLVSIVLPVFNGELYLAEAIESVLQQSYRDLEMIIVDDGSSDGTPEIIRNYQNQDSRIEIITQENKTLPVALSEGFKKASGEFLTWTSDDNRMKANCLETMVTRLVKDPSVEMVYANMDLIRADGSFYRGSQLFEGYQNPPGSEHVFLPSGKLDLYGLNTWPNNFIGGSFMYRDRVPLLIGDFSPHQFTREDYDYWLRINTAFKISHLGKTKPIYDYRVHDKSLTHRDNELNITRDRNNLMIFDDFRRDFFCNSSVWIIDSDASRDALVISKKLITLALEANQVVIDYVDFSEDNYPRIMVPLIYVKVITGGIQQAIPPTNLPATSLKVFLAASNNTEMSDPDPHWDMSILTHSKSLPATRIASGPSWIGCDDINAIFTAVDIKARSMHLEKVEQEIYSDIPRKYNISVVVCTFRRKKSLTRTLESLAIQTLESSLFEVIIVNNDPDDLSFTKDFSEQILQSDSLSKLNIRNVNCPIPGLSNARNAGLGEANAEIIVYVDDDATLDPNALEEYLQAFNAHPGIGVIGGHIDLQIPDKLEMPWDDTWKRYWSHFETNNDDLAIVSDWWEFPWGANWAAKRNALIAIGGFRSAYGRIGANYSGGEEIVAANQIKTLGYEIAVLPQAIARHIVETSRFSLKSLKETIIAGKTVQYQAQRRGHINSGISTSQIAKSLVKELGRSIRSALNGKLTKEKSIEAYYLFLANITVIKFKFLHAISFLRIIFGSRV